MRFGRYPVTVQTDGTAAAARAPRAGFFRSTALAGPDVVNDSATTLTAASPMVLVPLLVLPHIMHSSSRPPHWMFQAEERDGRAVPSDGINLRRLILNFASQPQ